MITIQRVQVKYNQPCFNILNTIIELEIKYYIPNTHLLYDISYIVLTTGIIYGVGDRAQADVI